MSVPPKRFTYDTQPEAFNPTEHSRNLRRHASIPASMFHQPPQHPFYAPPHPTKSQFQHPYPGGPLPPYEYNPRSYRGGQFPVNPPMPHPGFQHYPPPPVQPVTLPTSNIAIAKLPVDPSPGGLGLYGGIKTPAPVRQEVPSPQEHVREARQSTKSEGDVVAEEMKERAQHKMADKMWMEEQNRLQREVEEERKKYQHDLARGVQHRPVLPTFSEAPEARHPNSRSLDQAGRQPHQFMREERESFQREARAHFEVQQRQQEAAKNQAAFAKAAAERMEAEKAAEQAREDAARRERAKRQAEEQIRAEQEAREKFEEERRKLEESREASGRAHAEQEAFKREFMRRAEAKRAQMAKEKEERRQARLRKKEQERRWQEAATRANSYEQWGRAIGPTPWARPSRTLPPYTLENGAVPYEDSAMYGPPGPFEASGISELYDTEHEDLEIQHQQAIDREEERRVAMAAFERYDARWALFTKHPPPPHSLRFIDIPWPTLEPLPMSSPSSSSGAAILPHQVAAILNKLSISKFVLSPYHSEGKSDRVRIRAALLRFHPDKINRWLSLVQEMDRSAVVMGVEMVSRTLNEMMSRVQDD